jgi:hypothetical protein
MRTEVAEARVTAPAALRRLTEQALADVRAAGRIGRITVDEADGDASELDVTVAL